MKDTIASMVQSGISISLTNLLIGLSLAILLGLIIVVTYRASHRGFHYELRASQPRWVVMEVKALSGRPHWLESLVRTYELLSLPNSKLAFGIERTQHSLCLR